LRLTGPGKLSDLLFSVRFVTSGAEVRRAEEVAMRIDCDSCVGRGVHCHDCVVTVILNNPADPDRAAPVLELDPAEYEAVDSLATAGLVPPLRLVPVFRDGPESVRGIA
jgi:hypothetical protein